MSLRYGGARIRRGFAHFIVGKGVSSIAGFCAMVLVVRLLPVDVFADYSVLVALVELFAAISNLGLAHAVLRYVPELYAARYRIALRQFVFGALSLRSLILLAVAALAFALSERFTLLIGIDDIVGTFELFLLVVVFRATAQFLAQILESTLHQGSAQFGYSLSALSRMSGMLYLMMHGEATLTQVVLVEAVSEGLGMVIMLASVVRVSLSGGIDGMLAPSDDRTWLKGRLAQMANFAVSGYVQHLVALPFGSNMNRLVGGRLLGNIPMANFGFATSLYEYMKRYLPAQLLVGLIRPVLVARYSERNDFASAATLCEQVFQVNLLLIGFAFVFLASGGEETLTLISGGKYGGEALAILAFLLVVLILETHRLQLEVLVQTVERYSIMIPSNILLALSILPAIALVPVFGGVAFPAANAIGLLAANALVQRRLAREGKLYRHRWLASMGVVAAVVLAGGAGALAKHGGIHWLMAAFASLIFFGLIGWRLCRRDIRCLVSDLLDTSLEDKGKERQMGRSEPAAEMIPTHVKTVGILSMQRVVNYGSFMQAYALKRVVESFGHHCEFRDFRRGLPRHQGSKVKYPGMIARLAKLPIAFTRPVGSVEKRLFRKKLQNLFKEHCWPLLGMGPEMNYGLKCDVMIIGSDEVFNYTQNAAFGYVPCLFGHGIEARRIITYAASAGYANLPDIEADGIGEELAAGFRRIDRFSVRDENTREIVAKYADRAATLVLDPTLIYDFRDELVPSARQDGYLLIYAYEGRMEDPAEVMGVRQFALQNGLKTVSVGFYHHWCDENLVPTPFEMLGLFRDARHIVTDTFHGTIFSIKYNKQFVTLIRSEHALGSNANKVGFLLRQFGLEARVIRDMSLLSEALLQPIEYSVANNRLAEMRRQSLEFLSRALSCEVADRDAGPGM